MSEREEEPAGAARPAPTRSPDPESPAYPEVDGQSLDQIEDDDDDARAAAENLARRIADLNLRNELALSGFAGPAWDLFADSLARYGLAVVTSWLATHEMFRQGKIKNCYPGDPPARWCEDDRVGIANEVVALALYSFRERALLRGHWVHHGGATLKTYFVGRCVFEFPNVFRKWCKDAEVVGRRELHYDSAPSVLMDQPAAHRGTEDVVVDRLLGAAAMTEIPDDRTKIALFLRARGHSNPEIVEIMQTTKGTVEGIFHRHKLRAQLRAAPPDAGGPR